MLNLKEFSVYLSFQNISEIVIKRISKNFVDDVFDKIDQSILLDLINFVHVHLYFLDFFRDLMMICLNLM
jgi:hypothetical protein